MKPFVKIVTISIFSLFLAFQIAAAEKPAVNEITVGISQLMNSADQYPDNVIVQGVVSKVFPQDNLIGLIDNPFSKDCSVKTCKTPCPSSVEKKCTKDSAKTCPMAGNTKSDKACTKPCEKAASKECPMKSAIDSGNKCPMAAAKCPVAGDKKCDKPCNKAASKGCPMAAAAKDCPKTSGKGCSKPCSDPGYTMILPVKWEGDMPEPSDQVRVAGKITRENGRLLFVAKSITVMSN